MDILRRLNGVVEYLESVVASGEAVDEERMARIACLPPQQFYRVFSYIAGVTIYEYVRRRRLTLAAQRLRAGEARVIDVALECGYESPEAFARAFQAMHGVPPSAVRKGCVGLVAFPRIRFSITIKGEVSVNYRFVNKEAFTIVGKKLRVNNSELEKHNPIPDFWGNSQSEPWYKTLCDGCRTELGVMGVCSGIAGDGFDYYIAIERAGDMDTKGLDTLEVPACTWACFESVGPMPDAIQDLWKYVMTEWLPSSGYKHAGTPDLEVYAAGDTDAADYLSYVWIPVVKE